MPIMPALTPEGGFDEQIKRYTRKCCVNPTVWVQWEVKMRDDGVSIVCMR